MPRTISYPDGARAWLQSLTHQLGVQEVRRRLWHFLPGFLALSLAFVPRLPTVRLWVMVLLVVVGILVPAYLSVRYHRLYRRTRNEDVAPSILGYAIPVSVLCLAFRSHVEIPLCVAAIIAFGDGSATLAGLLMRGRRLPWNPAKSWVGMVAFAVCGTVFASCVYSIAAFNVSLAMAFLCVAPVVCVCAILETLPWKVNDNLTIGCAASGLLLAMQTLVIGWQ